MSVKIKINWDNENVVSESVRIYRADSVFTSASLPAVLQEIIGEVYEYEDSTTVEGQTYFYMLSAKLGEQEVFTQCFEVKTYDEVLGYWITNIVAYGTPASWYTSRDPANIASFDNYKNTINFASINYDTRPSATAGFSSVQKIHTIDKSPLNLKFKLSGYMSYGASCENPTTIEFQKADGTTVLALQAFRYATATQGLRYSINNMVTWTTVSRNGTNAQLIGTLNVLNTGIKYTNTSSSSYINSFNVGVNLSEVVKLKVTSNATCSTYSGGSVAYLFLECIENLN